MTGRASAAALVLSATRPPPQGIGAAVAHPLPHTLPASTPTRFLYLRFHAFTIENGLSTAGPQARHRPGDLKYRRAGGKRWATHQCDLLEPSPCQLGHRAAIAATLPRAPAFSSS